MNQAQSGIFLQSQEEPARIQILWGYFQHEILYLVWIIMEVSLLTPFLAAVFPNTRNWPPGLFLLWLLLLIYLPFNVVRLMSTMDWPRSRQRIILAGLVVLIYFLSIRALFYAPVSMLDFGWLRSYFVSIAEPGNLEWQQNLGWFILTVFLWWRGLRLVGKEFSIDNAGRRLRVGGLALAPLIIMASVGRVFWNAVPFIFLFFLASLTAVTLSRVEEIEKQQSGRSVSLNPKWIFSVTLSALLIILTSLFITFLISGSTLLTISSWLDPLWRALMNVGIVALNTILHLLEPFLKLLSLFIEFIVNLLTPAFTSLGQVNPAPIAPLATPPPIATEIPQETEFSQSGIKAINILLMIAFVLSITLALGRVYRKAEFAARESASNTQGASGLTTPRAGFGKKLLQRLGLLRDWRTATSIRKIYHHMCTAASISGYPRADAETPFEYLSTLDRAWPNNHADIHLITDAYVQIRYGELPESTAELEKIRQAWKRLESTPPIDETEQAKNQIELEQIS